MSNPKQDVQPSQAQSDNKLEVDKTFYCEVCEISCLTSAILEAHRQGAKHQKMKALLHGEGDAKSTQEVDDPATRARVRKFRKPGRSLKLYISKPDREPLIGIQHVIENTDPESTEPRFTCELCDHHSDLVPLVDHLNSFEHRKAYMAKSYPFLLKVPPAQNEDRVSFLRRMALDIERDEGFKMFRSQLFKNDALRFLENFEVDSDAEALSVMTLTQNLSEALKAYCLQKSNPAKTPEETPKPAPIISVNQRLTQLFETGNQVPFNAQNRNWNPQAQYAAKSQEAMFRSATSQQSQYTSGDNRGPQILQNTNIQQTLGAPVNPAQFAASFGRSGDSIGNRPPFAPNEPRGPGGFPSGERGFGNEYSLYDRGPVGGSIAPGSSGRLIGDRIPDYQAYRNNALNPSLDARRGERWIQEPASRYSRDPGARYQTSSEGFNTGLSSGYTIGSNTRMLPDSLAPQQGMGSLGFPKYLDPKSAVPLRSEPLRTSMPSDLYRELPRTMIDAATRDRWEQEPASRYMRDFPERLPLEPSVRPVSEMYSAGLGTRMLPANSLASASLHASNLPRATVPDKSAQGATSGLAADILTLIKGKDVKAASKILTTLAPSHPALKKVNIANLLNLLVQTGTIK